MPSSSQKQHDFFEKVANNQHYADAVNVPQDVAKDFLEADAEVGLWQSDNDEESEKDK